MRPQPTETAVIVPVPQAEPVVGKHRERYDVAASWGVPAHVTVLYPFVRPGDVGAALLERLASAVASVPAFDCSFRHCGWFGEDVLWLVPDPDEPFRALTDAVWGAFPQHPPYGGAHDDVVPHLTVGESRLASSSELRGVAATLSNGLPVSARVDRAVLIQGTSAPGSWGMVRELPLGGVPEGAVSPAGS